MILLIVAVLLVRFPHLRDYQLSRASRKLALLEGAVGRVYCETNPKVTHLENSEATRFWQLAGAVSWLLDHIHRQGDHRADIAEVAGKTRVFPA